MDNQENIHDVYRQWKKPEVLKNVQLTDEKLRNYVKKMVFKSFEDISSDEIYTPYFFIIPSNEAHDAFVRYTIKTPDQEVAQIKLEILQPFGKDVDTTPLVHTMCCQFNDETTLHTQYSALGEIGKMVQSVYHTGLYSDRRHLVPKHAFIWEQLCREQKARKTPYKTVKGDPIYQYTG